MENNEFFSGYLLQKEDPQDIPKKAQEGELPSKFSLEEFCNPAMHQGDVGACVGFAVSGAWSCVLNRAMKNDRSKTFTPSPYFFYTMARIYAGWPETDKGSYIRDALKAFNHQGCIPNKMYPTQWNHMPTEEELRFASTHKLSKYAFLSPRRGAATDIMQVLHNERLPVMIGVRTFSFWDTQSVVNSGHIPLPSPLDPPTGGHAVYLYGYDMSSRLLFGRNSWGTGWGNFGDFTIPFDYVENNRWCDAIWTFDETGF